MDITFNCNSCGQHIAIDEAGVGMSVQCPNCNQTLVVPNASTTNLARIPVTSAQIDPTSIYTLFRGRGPAKPTQIIGAKYFYRTTEQKVEGPFNKLEMRALMRKKVVEPETMVLCPVTQEWLPCERFPELPKPAYNKLLHFEKDARFSTLVQEIPQKIVEHIGDKISEAQIAFGDPLSKEPLSEAMGDKISEVKFASWLGESKNAGISVPTVMKGQLMISFMRTE